MSAYFAREDLEARLSATIVRKLFDDNNDGTSDNAPITRLIADACSKVDSYLRNLYEESLPLAAPYPNEVVRLSLDVAVAYAAQRHPEVVRNKDWKSLMDQAEADLDRLRSGKTRLDVVSTPEPAANNGAVVVKTADPADESPCPSGSFFEDMGSFSR